MTKPQLAQFRKLTGVACLMPEDLDQEYYRALYKPDGRKWVLVAYAAVTKRQPAGWGPGGGLEGMQQAHVAHGLERMREANYATRAEIRGELA